MTTSETRGLRRGLGTIAEAAVLGAWAYFALQGGAREWGWAYLGVPLGVVLWFDARPYRSAAAEVRLAPLARWLLVFRFVAIVFIFRFASLMHAPGWALAAVALLFLIGAVLRFVEESRPLRVVRPAPGGGFVVYFPPDARLEDELQALPGAEREGSHWKFPATKESADALLHFARERQFEFKP